MGRPSVEVIDPDRRRRTSSRIARRERRRALWSIAAVMLAAVFLWLLIALVAGYF
jgi:uncharacterized membrane-anchored protein